MVSRHRLSDCALTVWAVCVVQDDGDDVAQLDAPVPRDQVPHRGDRARRVHVRQLHHKGPLPPVVRRATTKVRHHTHAPRPEEGRARCGEGSAALVWPARDTYCRHVYPP